MNIIPAIDLIGGNAVRLQRGDYSKITVYDNSPVEVAKRFENDGAKYLHIVDLDGAKDGTLANYQTIEKIISATSLSVEVGGGIRNIERVKSYVDIGVDRAIIGTAAITEPDFLERAVSDFGDKISVGVDIKDGFVAIKGWLEISDIECDSFCKKLDNMGVANVICTDISKDGMMSGTNRELYKRLSQTLSLKITASGGVSSIDDVIALSQMNIWGAIIGKALYTGDVDLSKAIDASGGCEK